MKSFKLMLTGLKALTLMTSLTACIPGLNQPLSQFPVYKLEAAEQVETSYHENQLFNVSASPDGRYVFYGLSRHEVAHFRAPSKQEAYRPSERNFYLYDTQSRTTRLLDELKGAHDRISPVAWNAKGELILTEYTQQNQQTLSSYNPLTGSRKTLLEAEQLSFELVGGNLYLRKNQAPRIEQLNLDTGDLSTWLEVPLDGYQNFNFQVDADSLRTLLQMERSLDTSAPDPSLGFKVAMCGCARPPQPDTDWYLVDSDKQQKALPALKNLSDGFMTRDQEALAGRFILQKVTGDKAGKSVYVYHLYNIETGKAELTLNGERAWELPGERLLVQSNEDVAIYDLKTLQTLQKLTLPQSVGSQDFGTQNFGREVSWDRSKGQLLVSDGRQAGVILVKDSQLSYRELTKTQQGSLHLGLGASETRQFLRTSGTELENVGKLQALVIDSRPDQDAEVWLPAASGFGPGIKIPVASGKISYTPDEKLWSLR